jgi:hypothetical protein
MGPLQRLMSLSALTLRLHARFPETHGAVALGNDRQIISYWELDKAKPTRSDMQLLVQLLARTLHLSVGALTTGKGFLIPDLPDGRLDALHHFIRNLLPTVQSGSVQAVDLTNGSMTTMSLREAKFEIIEEAMTINCRLLSTGSDADLGFHARLWNLH